MARLLEVYSQDAVLEVNNNLFMKKKALTLAAAVFLGFGITTGIHCDEPLHAITNNTSMVVAIMESKNDFIQNYDLKVDAVRHYMVSTVKTQRKNPNDIKLSPEKIVELAHKEKFDIPLLLAQAHIESCFGMSKRARKTNSVFAIGSYDNGKNKRVYKTQDDCITDYINIINNRYLSQYNGNVELLLRPGNFKTSRGKCRYASNPSYETTVKNIRNKIIAEYPILVNC